LSKPHKSWSAISGQIWPLSCGLAGWAWCLAGNWLPNLCLAASPTTRLPHFVQPWPQGVPLKGLYLKDLYQIFTIIYLPVSTFIFTSSFPVVSDENNIDINVFKFILFLIIQDFSNQFISVWNMWCFWYYKINWSIQRHLLNLFLKWLSFPLLKVSNNSVFKIYLLLSKSKFLL
jgi:hypothetical protein